MNNVTAVMYHYVRNIKNGRYIGLKGLEIEEFERQILYFKSNYNIIAMEDFLASLNGGEGSIALPDKPMLLTFDDGYADHFINVLPILEKNRVKGSFFINSMPILEGKLLDVNKIQLILGAFKDISKLKLLIFEELNKLLKLRTWILAMHLENSIPGSYSVVNVQ